MKRILTGTPHWLAAVAALAAAALLAGCERPPIQTKQSGYRGTGMVDVQNPRTVAKLVPLNQPPAPLDAGSADGPKANRQLNQGIDRERQETAANARDGEIEGRLLGCFDGKLVRERIERRAGTGQVRGHDIHPVARETETLLGTPGRARAEIETRCCRAQPQ